MNPNLGKAVRRINIVEQKIKQSMDGASSSQSGFFSPKDRGASSPPKMLLHMSGEQDCFTFRQDEDLHSIETVS